MAIDPVAAGSRCHAVVRVEVIEGPAPKLLRRKQDTEPDSARQASKAEFDKLLIREVELAFRLDVLLRAAQ